MEPKSINGVEQREFLVQNDKFKMICFVFEDGKGLPNHTHNGLASIQVVSGEVMIAFVSGETFTLHSGDVLGFDARVQHNVISNGTSKVIVTIVY